MSNSSRQNGDTIVEVLICMVIVSSTLTGAFLLAKRSLNGNRQSQERVEALKVAEAQIERIRHAAITKQADVFTAGAAYDTPFCVNAALERKSVTGFTVNPQTDPFTGYVDCTESPNNTVSYYVAVRRSDFPASPTFTVSVRWDKAGGGTDKQEALLAYRLYQGN